VFYLKRFFLYIFIAVSAFSLFAQNSANPSALLQPYMASAPALQSTAAVLLDAETGTVLYAKNPDAEIPPASLTKLMTMHLAFREIEAGRASMDEVIPIGVEAWAQSQPYRSSLMFLAPGQTVNLRELLMGLAVPSGTDAAVAVALRFAPSVASFTAAMNEEARRMGLVKTHFVEPSGVSENNMTTAAEFARFCQAYVKLHPKALAEFHSAPEFAYPKAANVGEAFRDDPKTIVQTNHNMLLGVFPGTDGLKTGYIDEAGYNIALSAEQNSTRLIAVILGAPARRGGDRIRDDDGKKLLGWGFANFRTIRPLVGDIESVRLWKGRANRVELVIAEETAFTVPADRGGALWLSTEITDPLIAPLDAASPVGDLVLSDEKGELRRIPLLSAASYEKGNIFKRLWHSIRLFFYRKK
jgi:D-alanyl-D-alanine carboxypeptidase (penicillin-binding protein 5/6)